MKKAVAAAAGLGLVVIGLALWLPGRMHAPPSLPPPAVVELTPLPESPVADTAPPVRPTPAADLPAWRRNAVPWDDPGRPKVVIVIDDMGVDRQRSARAVALPGPLTLSFLPYAEHVRADAASARAHGHELLLHLPMEPVSAREDPGPHALFAAAADADLLQRLDWNLARFDGFVGANNHMGSRFTADARAMALVLDSFAARGLLWLDSRTTGASVAERTAVTHAVPFAARDIFIDHDPSPAAVAAQLRAVEALARRKGFAIAIGHPRDATLAALEDWLPQLEEKGFALAPLTATVSGVHFGG